MFEGVAHQGGAVVALRPDARLQLPRSQLLPATQQHRRRATLTTPGPTSLPTPFTPVPTLFTPVPSTAVPSAAPSASPVPTTEGITTHAQLRNAVADISDNSMSKIVVVEADISFPSQAPITVGSGTSVAVVGRSAVDGGHVTLNGAGHSRHFLVEGGGTLHLSHVNLVNGSVPVINCGGACMGGSILAISGGTLIMRSCNVRGGGSEDVNTYAGGVALYGGFGDFFNITFTQLRAGLGAAVYVGGSTDGYLSKAHFDHCIFTDNVAHQAAAVWINQAEKVNFVGCRFLRNHGCAIIYWYGRGGEIVDSLFYENTGGVATTPGLGGAGVIVAAGEDSVDIKNSVFKKNVGSDGLDGGAVSVARAATATFRNVSFISNIGYQGAGFCAIAGSSLSVFNCSIIDNYATYYSGAFAVSSSEVIMYDTLVAKNVVASWGVFRISKESVFHAYGSVFRDGKSGGGEAGIVCEGASVCSLTDCAFLNNRAESVWAALSSGGGSTLTVSRAVIADNRAQYYGGCFGAHSGGILVIDDSEIINCECYTVEGSSDMGGGVLYAGGGSITITNSRIIGSWTDGKGSIAVIYGGGSLRIAGSKIANSSAPKFAIYDDNTLDDFAIQLNTVDVEGEFDISSSSKILVQNCEGLISTAADNATVASCASTSDYCLGESCSDTTIGIECICEYKGEQTAFPTDCMQSAVIGVPLPSTHTLTYIIPKPWNETAELMLANVRV